MEKYGKPFKELNGQEKREFIWQYYKLHIFGGIIVIAIVFNLLNHYVFNPPKQIGVDITITAPFVTPNDFEILQKEVVALVEEKTGNRTANMEVLNFSPQNDGQTQVIMTTKLVAKASTGDLDILILDRENVDYFRQEEVLLPLSEYLTQEEIEKYAKSLITITKDGKEIPVAFELKEDARVRKLVPMEYQGYVGMFVKVKDKEISKEILEILLKE